MSDLFERMDQTLIQRIVEGAILASSQPLTLAQLYGLFPEDQPAPPSGSIEQAIEALKAAGADRGVELVEVASGFRFQVQQDVHAWVARLWTERPTRYTRATLETLALIAYRQPITRGEIEQIRGVAVNSNIVKMLEEREWIRVIGHRDVPGKPALFGTTKAFLDYFNLRSLDQLPPLSELNDIPELEPQLDFEPRAVAPVAVSPETSDDADADTERQDGGDTDTDADADTGTEIDAGIEATAVDADADLASSEAEDDRIEGIDSLDGDNPPDDGDLDAATRIEGVDVQIHDDIATLAQADDGRDDTHPSPSGDDAGESPTGTDDESSPERTA